MIQKFIGDNLLINYICGLLIKLIWWAVCSPQNVNKFLILVNTTSFANPPNMMFNSMYIDKVFLM